jgi:Flp pilus assembly protein TadB
MNAASTGTSFVRQRLQWTIYGFIAGILIGLVLGWLFHGVLTAAFNFLLVAALLVPFVLAFLFWRKVKSERQADLPPAPAAHDPSLASGPAIETTYTIADRAESRER